MKVILNENIETLGHIGDIVKVAPGYARNYLLPKKLAIVATDKNAKALEHAKRQMVYKKNKALEAAKNLGAKLEALAIVLTHKAGDEGKLFGSVTNMDVAAFLKANGFDIDRKNIVLADAIKQTGEFTATLKLHPEVTATLKITVAAA
ncbi:MAG: 50S ribosomal protein L9 [Desulfuromonadaceae bacterium]|nr:50S ribosomal protein L9 [Desulfuromonadaceae bacterium]MDD5107644.1 50S ribosomal protein L9 [Desulfuromonadaceae bacterium]